MKTLSNKISKYAGKSLAVAALFATLVGCGKGGNGDVMVGGFNLSGCPTCSASMARPVVLDNAVSATSDNVVQLTSTQLIVDYNTLYQTPQAYSSSYNNYSGAIAIGGNFVLSAPVADSYGGGYTGGGGYYGCALPAGTYNIQSSAVGRIAQGTNLELPELVINPGNVRARITQGMLWKGQSNETRIRGILQIVSVDGRACSNNFYGNIQ